ncbi:discoidin domain-containing protein [Actinomadura barringtoniae]|uniref:alpha-L-fucosidase n=1 Tax=Actinomadura barringtoniae TaxID=1427535 RepID=A0A939T1H2_9ACTN|nr:discoidin domain-containing protein [Actinomadura barringtoniae]MBO2447576.1 discoidin domain-containing protein [Actinomadura barringtoniae]
MRSPLRALSSRVLATLASALVVLAVTAVCAVTAAPPAKAELQHPRQAFLRASLGELFLHWGMRTSPAHTSCGAWESAVTGGGWKPEYWVNEAKKLHTQYLVLATFHSRLGYARPWPSAIPGSCSTKRDFLGELITAAEAQGMRVVLYMTDDPQWWNEGLPSGQSWLNSSAYSSYKGHTVDLKTRDGFGEFSYDNFVEIMQRYPKLGGFWIDNDNAYWERNGLYERIRHDRPDFTLSNNNEDTPIMDMISNEQKTGMSPSYDYPQAVYTAAPRLTEADFKLPTNGSWWYTGTDNAVDYKLTLGRLITNAGSSIKALMAETPMKNGRMPPAQEAFNNFADTYLEAIKPSLIGTEGGGYMYGGLQPGFWNDGAHGVTTVSKTDPNLHFVHVVTKPSGGTLKVRDNGYKVSAVTNLRTGAAVSFSQSGGTLTLSGISSWDQYDTVFKVVTSGREGILPPSSYTMSASASASGHPASAAADGDYLTYWDAGSAQPVSLRFDLGSAKRIQYIGINQREDSTTYPASGSARIRDYRVYVSDDGTNWGSPIKTGTLPNHRGVQIIDLPVTTARHVRLEKVNSQGTARLRVDEAWIGTSYAGGGTAPGGQYEAENATISRGVVESDHAGYSGTGYVNTDNAAGPYVEWKVDAAQARSHTLGVRYANGPAADRPMDVTVNGTVVAAARSFPSTGSWTDWATSTLTVPLNAGANTIRVTATSAEGAPNLDMITIG